MKTNETRLLKCTFASLAMLLSVVGCSPVRPNRNDVFAVASPSSNFVSTNLSGPEIEQTLAPIALYPNAVLVQVLMASANPQEVETAAQWAQANSALSEKEAISSIKNQDWDDSVKALIAFPEILEMMSTQPEWMERVGYLVSSQTSDTLAAITDLRRRAYEAGTLDNDPDDVDVFDDSNAISINGSGRFNFYIPNCDSYVAYGAWPSADYLPVDAANWTIHDYWRPCFWGAHIDVGERYYRHYFNTHHHHHSHDSHCPPRGSVAWKHPTATHEPARFAVMRSEPGSRGGIFAGVGRSSFPGISQHVMTGGERFGSTIVHYANSGRGYAGGGHYYAGGGGRYSAGGGGGGRALSSSGHSGGGSSGGSGSGSGGGGASASVSSGGGASAGGRSH